MAHSTNASVRPFGIRDKIGYMFGDFGNDFTFILSFLHVPHEILHGRHGCGRLDRGRRL